VSPERRFALPLLLLALGAPGCSNDWRTDMYFHPAGGLHAIARPEPEGSVPLGARPFFYDRDDAEGYKEAFPTSPESVARGRAIFSERCVACHGPEGHGGGPVSRAKPPDPKTGQPPPSFPPAPDLGYAAIQARPDGYLYATILLGGKAMPVMREGLDERDLWDLVHYLRTLQPKVTP
jgi:mono/diheme cytochrome c family protein